MNFLILHLVNLLEVYRMKWCHEFQDFVGNSVEDWVGNLVEDWVENLVGDWAENLVEDFVHYKLY